MEERRFILSKSERDAQRPKLEELRGSVDPALYGTARAALDTADELAEQLKEKDAEIARLRERTESVLVEQETLMVRCTVGRWKDESREDYDSLGFIELDLSPLMAWRVIHDIVAIAAAPPLIISADGLGDADVEMLKDRIVNGLRRDARNIGRAL